MAGFIELLEEKGIVVKPGSKPSEIRLCCPFCLEREGDGDARYKLHVNVRYGYGICFNCDWRCRGTAKEEILKHFEAEGYDSSTQENTEVEIPEPVKLPEDFMYISEVRKSDEVAYRAKRYLHRRGITQEVMEEKSIGVSLVGRYAYRIIFPVIWKRELKGIVCRDFTDQAQVRYLNSKGHKGLYNLPLRLPKGYVILSEGIFKCLALERVLGKPSAALLGHSITEGMLEQLEESRCKKALVWPDPDKAGRRGAIHVCHALKNARIQALTIYPIPTKQADEMTEDEVADCYRNRVPFTWATEQRMKL